MTPEQLKALFDGNAIILIFIWGLICKYVPFLARIPNVIIPWIGALGYVVARFAVPDAHAGPLSGVPDAIGCIIGGFTNAVWARQLYEGFGRGLLERLFKLKKAVPA